MPTEFQNVFEEARKAGKGGAAAGRGGAAAGSGGPFGI